MTSSPTNPYPWVSIDTKPPVTPIELKNYIEETRLVCEELTDPSPSASPIENLYDPVQRREKLIANVQRLILKSYDLFNTNR